MIRPKGLGRGLDALLSGSDDAAPPNDGSADFGCSNGNELDTTLAPLAKIRQTSSNASNGRSSPVAV